MLYHYVSLLDFFNCLETATIQSIQILYFSWYTYAYSVTHTFTPPSLSVHLQTLLLSLLVHHPHWDKSSLLQRVKPGLIWTVAFPLRSYSWSLCCLQQSYYTTYRVSPSALQEVTHTYTHTHTQKTKNTRYSFSLYSSLILEIAGSIFSLITLLDMMHQKFTLSVYRNTLNRTQGFTMDTRLTLCQLHLQQWMTFSRFFVTFFSRCYVLPPSPCRSPPSSWRPPDGLTKAFYSVFAVEVFFLLFYKHNMYRNYTQTGYVSEYDFCSTVVNSQYKSATYTMLMQ